MHHTIKCLAEWFVEGECVIVACLVDRVEDGGLFVMFSVAVLDEDAYLVEFVEGAVGGVGIFHKFAPSAFRMFFRAVFSQTIKAFEFSVREDARLLVAHDTLFSCADSSYTLRCKGVA